jgi:hypothetical protein
MFPFNRKSGAQPREPWNQARADYEEAVQRCYKWKTVTLALSGFQKFLAFNFTYGREDERKPVIEDDFQFWGVVHELDQLSKHVRCEVKILPAAKPAPVLADHIGSFVLTHFSMPRDKTPCEDQPLLLDVTLHDATSMWKTSLIDALRDAALSGFRFMRIELQCPESTNEECERALAEMRAQGYAYSRNILAVKMWPKIELQNAPKWSRPENDRT